MQDDKDLRSCYNDVSEVFGNEAFFEIMNVVYELIEREDSGGKYKAATSEVQVLNEKAMLMPDKPKVF